MAIFLFFIVALIVAQATGMVYTAGTTWGRDGQLTYLYTFMIYPNISANATTAPSAPIYHLVWPNGTDVAGHRNIIDVEPGDVDYSDLWELMLVNVTDPSFNAQLSPLTSFQNITAAGFNYTFSGTYVNCPVVNAGDTLEDPNDAPLVHGWYKGQDVVYFDFGPCSNLLRPLYHVVDQLDNFIQPGNTDVTLGSTSYAFPFWTIYFNTSALPSFPFQFYSNITANSGLFAFKNVIANCPIVYISQSVAVEYPLLNGWYDYAPVEYYDFGPLASTSTVTTSPIYVFMHNGAKVGHNVVATNIGDAAYSPLWQVNLVNVDSNYVANSLTSDTAILASSYTRNVTQLLVNCPIVPLGSTLQTASNLQENGVYTLGWYKGARVGYFDFGANPQTKAPILVITNSASQQVGYNVINTVPGNSGYTAFWDVQVHQLGSGETWTANSIPDATDLKKQFTFTPVPQIRNCPVVYVGTPVPVPTVYLRGQVYGAAGQLGFLYSFFTYKNVTAGTTSAPTAPIYHLTWANGSDVVGQNNIIDVNRSSPGYSDLWQVNTVVVPPNYVANTAKSYSDIANWTITATSNLVNCPLVNHGDTLENPNDAPLVHGWYQGTDVVYFDFGAASATLHPLYHVVASDGSTFIQPGNAQIALSSTSYYFPFWTIYFNTTHLPQFPTKLYSAIQASSSSFTFQNAIVNCPVVFLAQELGVDYPLINGWYKNLPIQYYNFDPLPGTTVTTSPIYTFQTPSGIQLGDNVVATNIGDATYSPLWEVNVVTVPANYTPNTYTDVGSILSSGLTITKPGIFKNCPIVPFDSTLETRPNQQSFGNYVFGWYEGSPVFYFDFGIAPKAAIPIYVLQNSTGQVGNNVVNIVPGGAGYSPFWQVYEYTLTAADDYTPNSITDATDLQAKFTFTKAGPIVNCPVVYVPSSQSPQTGPSIPFGGQPVYFDSCSYNIDPHNFAYLDLCWTYNPDGTTITFGVRGQGGAGEFQGFGFSPNTTGSVYMVGSVAVIGSMGSTPPFIEPFYLSAKVTSGVQPSSKLTITNASIEETSDHNITMIFTRPLSIPNYATISPNTQTSLIYSRGPQPSGPTNLQFHTLAYGNQLFSLTAAASSSTGGGGGGGGGSSGSSSVASSSTGMAAGGGQLVIGGQTYTFAQCAFQFDDTFDLCYNLGATEIEIAVVSTTDGFTAFGFSDGGTSPMIGSLAVIGWSQGSNSYIGGYSLTGKLTTQVIPSTDLGITDAQVSTLNGRTTIYFKRPLAVTGKATISPTASIPIVWSRGDLPTSPTTVQYHNYRNFGARNFFTGASSVAGFPKTTTAHAVLMSLAWGVILPIGVMVARYGKGMGPTWIHYHRGFQLFGLILMTIGFIIGFAKVKSGSTAGLVPVHMALGITIFALGWFNPINAIFRPHPEPPTTKRFFWAKLHMWVGRVAVILAYVQIPIGMHLVNASRGYVALYVIGVAVAIAIYMFLSFYYDYEEYDNKIKGGGGTVEHREMETMKSPDDGN